MANWYNIRKRFIQILEENESEKRIDKGLLFLSLALFVWAGSGLWVYLNSGLEFSNSIGYSVVLNLFSILNNTFLLLALSYFYYAPKFIYNNKRNLLILIIIAAIVSISTLVLSNFENTVDAIETSAIPDLALSLFLSLLLAISLYRTFIKQGMVVIAFISVFDYDFGFLLTASGSIRKSGRRLCQ